jgi:hypothetical protein
MVQMKVHTLPQCCHPPELDFINCGAEENFERAHLGQAEVR